MDIKKHELLRQIYKVMLKIDKLGASKLATEIMTDTGKFANNLEKYVDENKEKLNFIHELFDDCPDLEKEGLKNFDGYYTTYKSFINEICGAAWDGQQQDYNSDPFELIYRLVAERDEAKCGSIESKPETTIVNVRWNDGYLETFNCSDVRFGSDLLWMRLENSSNRHIPLRQARWFSTTPESHENRHS